MDFVRKKTKKIKIFIRGNTYWFLAVFSVAIIIYNLAFVNAETTIEPHNLSSVELDKSISTDSSIPYSVNLKDNIGANKAIEFREGENTLSFRPTDIRWDSGAIKGLSLNTSAGYEDISNGKSFKNAFGLGISVEVIPYKDVFRKIVKIDSLSQLGAIPLDAKFLELEFEIETSYPIPLGIIKDNIQLSDSVRLMKAHAWDSEDDVISIESEIVKKEDTLFLVKRIPISWLKSAKFPVYADADTSVTGDVSAITGARVTLWGPYWTDVNTAVVVFADSNSDIAYASTTDGGATWATSVIQAGNALRLVTWFDQETPSDTGTLVHVTWLDTQGTDAAFYTTIDISNGDVASVITIDDTITVDTGNTNNRSAITKARSGDLIYALSTQTEIRAYRSSTSTASWVGIADPFETATEEDWLLLYPANTGSDEDVAGIFGDRSAGEISIKMYDQSLDSWTETSINSSITFSPSNIQYDAAVRHSDSHIILATHSNDDNSTDDLLTYDLNPNSIASPGVTAGTNIFTDKEESGYVGILINQQNDDIYFAFASGTPTLNTSADIIFYLSDDDLSTWEAESAYSEAAAGDLRRVQGGRTVDSDGGRVQWVFYDDDATELFVNLVNDIEIAASASDPTLQQVGYKWFANANSTDVGMGAQINTPIRAPAQGTPFRLRLLLHTASAQIGASGTTSDLRFAVKTGATCGDETFTDLAADSGDIRFYDNSTPSDGDNLTANNRDPKHVVSAAEDTVVNQDYEEANGFTNSVAAIPAGQDGMWDFSLYDFSAPANTIYCFKAVQDAGGDLGGGYSVYPEITTAQSVVVRLNGTVRMRVVRLF